MAWRLPAGHGGRLAEEGRNRYRRMAARAYGRLAEEVEISGDLVAATDFARRQRDLLPNELDAWKRLIRLLNATGDLLAAETERNALLARYASRGHPVPPPVLDMLVRTTSPPTTPHPPPHERAREAQPGDDPVYDTDARRPPAEAEGARGLDDLRVYGSRRWVASPPLGDTSLTQADRGTVQVAQIRTPSPLRRSRPPTSHQTSAAGIAPPIQSRRRAPKARLSAGCDTAAHWVGSDKGSSGDSHPWVARTRSATDTRV